MKRPGCREHALGKTYLVVLDFELTHGREWIIIFPNSEHRSYSVVNIQL